MKLSGIILVLALILITLAGDNTAKLSKEGAIHSFPNKSQESQENYEFINGQWFDGSGFVGQTFYSVNGILTKNKPSRIDSTIDLKDKYIIPPFSEAHNHNVGGRDGLDKLIQTYLKDGVFYVKNPNSIRKQTAEILDMVNLPSSIDFTYANGGLTGAGGHPIKLYEDLVSYGSYPGWTKQQMENEGYFVINDESDLKQKWNLILSGKPKFIKTYLLYSEEYEKRKDNPGYFGSRGLNPTLLPDIVKKAHQSKLRVTTHVETADDFHNAVIAGVDEIAHVPGYYIPKEDKISRYSIAEEDAKLAAKKNVFVVTTTLVSTRTYAKSPERLKEIQENQKRNIELLTKHKVRIAIGSDAFWTTAASEALNLFQMKVFDNLTLLKIWCEMTPQTIFPNRKIGYLKQGYEASFLALDENPIKDFLQVKNISLRVKQGHLIKLN